MVLSSVYHVIEYFHMNKRIVDITSIENIWLHGLMRRTVMLNVVHVIDLTKVIYKGIDVD